MKICLLKCLSENRRCKFQNNSQPKSTSILINKKGRINIQETIVKIIKFAYTDILAEEENDLENYLRKIDKIMKENGMKLNKNKIKMMVVCQNKNTNLFDLR